MRTKVIFVQGLNIKENQENVIFTVNSDNTPIPMINQKIQFPKQYWDITGNQAYIVKEVVYQYVSNQEVYIYILTDF